MDTNDYDYLKNCTNDEIMKLLIDKTEELKLSKAFNDCSIDSDNDTMLQWRGKQRFLAEKILPVKLKPIKDKSLNDGNNCNKIIDGDNLSVMYSILKDYRGKINVIYMDPPYNTGEEVFPYNDNFLLKKNEVEDERKRVGLTGELVTLDDPTRHTKWINHMAPRLWNARKLLSEDGVIIISIDEHELPRLWILMEEIFNSNNRIATLIWNRSRKNDSKYISEGHEYILIWAKNKEYLDSIMTQKGKWRIEKPGVEAHMIEFKRLCKLYGDDYDKISEELKKSVKGIKSKHPLWTVRQYVGVDKRSMELGPYKEDDPSWPSGVGPRYDVIHPQTNKPVKVPTNGWRFTNSDKWNDLIAEDRVVWKLLDKGIPKIKKYLMEGRDIEVMTSVIDKESRGSVLLSKAIFGSEKSYKNPKDHEILKKLFTLVTWNTTDAIFLDPYAGSGTTAHAVLDMNLEDNGNRQFILIEGGYVRKNSKIKQSEYTNIITAERVRRVITGNWADKKEHNTYNSGFTFYKARKTITKKELLESDRENLADIILQVAEEDSNRIDCRIFGYEYIIGRTRSGCGIALVWQHGKVGCTLTLDNLKKIIIENEAQNLIQPVHIYAAVNEAPVEDEIYRFHQIPESIMIKLGITYLDSENEGDI